MCAMVLLLVDCMAEDLDFHPVNLVIELISAILDDRIMTKILKYMLFDSELRVMFGELKLFISA